MIPKKIHYCWFGRGEKPKLAEKCIASWKKCCPDYEIIEWNEDNFDVNVSPYSKWCYENKKWAFLSDYARLVIIEKCGGFYFDTDVEIIRNLDELLSYEAVYGFENNDYVNTGEGFGSQAGHRVVRAMLLQYNAITPDLKGNYELVSCPVLNTLALNQFGLHHDGKRQSLEGAEVFPEEYFNPFDNATGRLNKTKNTFSIHWYAKSWINSFEVFRSILLRPFHRIFGVNCFAWLRKKK